MDQQPETKSTRCGEAERGAGRASITVSWPVRCTCTAVCTEMPCHVACIISHLSAPLMPPSCRLRAMPTPSPETVSTVLSAA